MNLYRGIRTPPKVIVVAAIIAILTSTSITVIAGLGSAQKTGKRTTAYVEAYADPSGGYIYSYGKVTALDGNWVAMYLVMKWWYYPSDDGPYVMHAVKDCRRGSQIIYGLMPHLTGRRSTTRLRQFTAIITISLPQTSTWKYPLGHHPILAESLVELR